MSKIHQCFLKNFNGSSKKTFEEDEEFEFDPSLNEDECNSNEDQNEDTDKEEEQEQEEQEQKTEEEIKQLKKIGLMCHCGLDTILREVKKDGPNKGKMFYTCSKLIDEKCNYFMWKDESDDKRKKCQIIKLKEEPTNDEMNDKINESHTNEEEIKKMQKAGLMCNCKLPSVMREVKKDGPNKGKMFYTCSKHYDDKCNYFVWKNT